MSLPRYFQQLSNPPVGRFTPMVRPFAASPDTWSARILCYYHNRTHELQVARIASTDQIFERVVFPGQRLLFEALPDAILELLSASRTDAIRCKLLQVSEDSATALSVYSAPDPESP